VRGIGPIISRGAVTTILAAAGFAAACSNIYQPDRPPSVRIVGLPDSVRFLEGDTLRVTAEVESGVFKTSGPVAVRWLLEDSLVGSGLRLNLPLVVPGAAVITAEAEDGAGLLGRDRVTFEVLPNAPPVPVALSVDPGTAFYASDTVRLAVRGMDVETQGGPFRVEWVSSAAGVLGTGDSLELQPGRLPLGSQVLTARLADPQGLVDSLTTTIEVVPAPARLHWWRRFPGATAARTHVALRDDGVVIVALGQVAADCRGCLIALGSDGVEQWRRPIGNSFPWDHSGGVTIAPDGRIFAFDHEGQGYAFSPDGALLWQRQIFGNDPHGRLALGPDGSLYGAGAHPDDLRAALMRFDPADGTRLWEIRRTAGYAHAGAFVAPDQRVVAGIGGQMVWATPAGLVTGDGPATIYTSYSRGAMGADGTVYVPSWNLQAIAPDGTIRWTADLGGYCCSAQSSEPVVDGRGVVYTARFTEAFAFREVDGSRIWSRTIASEPIGSYLSLTTDGGLILNGRRSLLVLDAATGNLRWEVPLAYDIGSSIGVAPNGLIYFATAEGRVMALRGDAPLDLAAPWPTWRADNRRTASVIR
jgi:outer membrane protein assembly factor BamB